MLYWLQDVLREAHYKIPMVFSYTSTRMILAAVTSLIITISLGPWFIRKLQAISQGQSIRTEDCPTLAHQHQSKRNTPTMGGILILSSLLISAFLWMNPFHPFTVILAATTLILGGLGAVDDYRKLQKKSSKGVSAKTKLLVQMSVGLALGLYLLVPSITQFFSTPSVKQFIANFPESLTLQQSAARIYIPFLKGHVIEFTGAGVVLMFFWIMFVVTGASNAVNLTDGLDGLATGCVLIAVVPFVIIAFVSNHLELARYLNILYIEGSSEIAIFLSALVGSCVGFLWYNGYPAQIFMGDTGSLALGGILGVTAILLKKELLLGIVGGIFVAEALSVIIQVVSYRYRGKKRVFLCAPLHHHFEYKGWPETKVVLRFWIIGLLLSAIGIASLKFQ